MQVNVQDPPTVEHTFDRVDPVVAGQLQGADIGALGVDETGFIGWCQCGHRTQVRYSAISAQSAIAVHVLGPNGLAS